MQKDVLWLSLLLFVAAKRAKTKKKQKAAQCGGSNQGPLGPMATALTLVLKQVGMRQ